MHAHTPRHRPAPRCARTSAALALAVTLASALAACSESPFRTLERIHFARTLFSVRDHTADFRNLRALFPVRDLPASDAPAPLPVAAMAMALPEHFGFAGATLDTAAFLATTDTTGLIVVKDGAVVYERYFRGATPSTRSIAWSVSKSFASALVGIAVAEGSITSVEDPVTKYVPTLAGSAYEGVRIKDVLQMSSGARWNEDYTDPKSDVNRFGRAIALGGSLDALAGSLTREFPPGTYHRYNTMDTQVLGMVLRSATGDSLTHLLSTRLWNPLGMQDPAYYLTDRDGVEFAAGGLNASLRDCAKFGLLYAEGGAWHGRQLVPAGWVHDSITPDAPQLLPGRRSTSAETWGYGYQWWIPDLAGGVSAVGIFNQFIYVNAAEHLVIAKASANHAYGTGHGDDETTDHEAAHIALFRAIESALHR
jgi:CubicO group peptidase (beta-lactamase class C family)